MAAQSPDSSPQDGSGGNESSDNLVLEVPQPMREDYIQNAVKFLSHPKVKGAPVIYRRSFLEKKGLTKEEIDEAFRREPDLQPNAAGATAAGSQQENNPDQSTGVQPYTSVDSAQPVTGPVTAGPIIPRTQSKFSWFHTLLAAGLFLGFGASAAVFLKKLFLPRLKLWVHKVVVEGDGTEDNKLESKLYEATAEAVKASASALSAIAKTNEALLASKDEEKKILMNLTQALDLQAKVFKTLSESLKPSREDRFPQYRLLEEDVPSASRNGPAINSWRAPQQTNVYTAAPNSDFGSGRHSFMPVPTEPTSGSFSRSYVETWSTGQRGERPSGTKQPWEIPQYSQQRPGFGSLTQLSDGGLNSEMQYKYYGPPYHLSGKAVDTQVAAAEESPFQRHWVPPQPPGVVMPEAAVAIRQPKSLPKQQSGDGQPATGADAAKTSETISEMQINDDPRVSDDASAEVPSNGSSMISVSHGETGEQSEAV